MDPLLAETATRILSDHADSPSDLWAALEDNGLTRVWAAEADGGFDLAPIDGFGLMRIAGAHAATVPLADTLMATWFLTEAKLPVPAGKIAVLIDGWQRGVPFGNSAEHLVRVRGCEVSLHQGHLQGIVRGIGQDNQSMLPSHGAPLMAAEMPHDGGLLFAALSRASQMCGALEVLLRMSISFSMQREQFGRPLSKFQAVQHLLSEMGAEAAAADAIVDHAVMQVSRGLALNATMIAAAKYRVGLAAGIVSDHAHQVHGAIGYTGEFGLARLTRRLWQWRDDFGGEAFWGNELGRAALAAPGPLWPLIVDGGLL